MTKCRFALRAGVERSLGNAKVVNFVVNHLSDIMSDLGVTTYRVGGSVATLIYGLDLGRVPHDVDIIVPKGTISMLKEKVSNSLLYEKANSSDSENSNHFAIKAIKTPIIDFIEVECMEISHTNHIKGLALALPKDLIESKKKYNHIKDVHDLRIMLDFFEIEPERTKTKAECLSDIDALKILKMRMEEGE